MDQKQDLILQYLTPKKSMITEDDASSLADSITAYDVAKAMATTATASGDEKSTTALGGEYKLKSSGSKKLSSSSSDTDEEDDDDIDADKEDDDDDDDDDDD